MNGWVVQQYIYWGLLAFIALWIIGTCLKDGLWSNALLAFNWLVATSGAVSLWQPVTKLTISIAKPAPNDQLLILAIAMGLYWILFLLFFVALRTATDGLSRVKVAFHPVIDKIGSFVFCGLLFVCIAAWSLPVVIVLEMGKPAT